MKIIFASLVALAVGSSIVVSQEVQHQNEGQATKLTVNDGKIDEIEQKVPKKIESQIRHKTKKYHKDASSYEDSLKVETPFKPSSKPSNEKNVDFRSPKEPKFVIIPEADDVLDNEFVMDEVQIKNVSESEQLDAENSKTSEESLKSSNKQESKSQKSSEDQKSLKKNKTNKNKYSHSETQEKHSRSGRARRDSSASKKGGGSSSKNSPSKAGKRRKESDSRKSGTKGKSDKKRRK